MPLEFIKRSSLQSAKTRLGADYGSGHELLIAIFRLKQKKVGKTIRPFRYDLNQIAYEKEIQGTRSDRVPEELWKEVHDIVQEKGIKIIPKKKKCKKQNGCLGRPYKQLRKEEKLKAKKRKDVPI